MKDYKNYLNTLEDFKNGKIPDDKIKCFPFFNQCNFKINSLVIIAGRPGIGKTTFALNILKKIIENNRKTDVVYFSLEMNKTEIFDKLTAMTVDFVNFKWLNNKEQIETWKTLIDIKMAFFYDRLRIYDNFFEINEIINAIIKLKKQHPDLKVVFIDYLGLSISYESDRYLKFGKFTREMHQLAKKLNICIVALNQLNRFADNSEVPELIHLRDSGTIEQDAEQVFLLYEKDQKFYVKIAKNRYGISGITQQFDFLKEKAIIKETDVDSS